MFGLYFGKYLVKKGIITNEQYNSIILDSKNTKVKMGLLAVEDGMMTSEQVEEVYAIQRTTDKRFGDIAISKGYLTEQQVHNLLEKQGDEYLLFAQALNENNILSSEDIPREISAYKRAEQFTALDVEALMSGDVDRIVPVFTKEDIAPPIVKDYIALLARNFVRFVDTHFRMEKIERIYEYTAPFVAAQELDGDYKIFCGLCGEGEGIKHIAEAYGKEEFETVDMDALDAACEFLNCNNGLYATWLCWNDGIEVDMLPPVMKDSVTTIKTGGNMFRVPFYIKDSRVDLIICIESKWILD